MNETGKHIDLQLQQKLLIKAYYISIAEVYSCGVKKTRFFFFIIFI
jgi:hypothetical protein